LIVRSSNFNAIGDIHMVENGRVLVCFLAKLGLIVLLKVIVKVVLFDFYQVPLVDQGGYILLNSLVNVIKIVVSHKTTLLDMLLLTNYQRLLIVIFGPNSWP
jgi:hypothetical protein